jgi:hypothetical protein
MKKLIYNPYPEAKFYRKLPCSGGSALSRELSELLKKHSKPVPPIDILNSAANSDGGENLLYLFVLCVVTYAC